MLPRILSVSAWRPSPTFLIAGGLVVLGFVLTGVGTAKAWWWFLLLTGLGTFGPGLLRELGWLRDKDEYQLRAAHRAGYHAFLAAGFLAFLWIAFVRSGERALQNPEELATFFLAVLWFTWLFSALVSYWGARATAVRVLLIYGGCWLAFNVVGNLDSVVALVMQSLLTVPFFACAFLARRWPRATGIVLLAASVFFVQFFGLLRAGRLGLVVNATTAVLFVGPLLASGIALLARGAEGRGGGEAAG